MDFYTIVAFRLQGLQTRSVSVILTSTSIVSTFFSLDPAQRVHTIFLVAPPQQHTTIYSLRNCKSNCTLAQLPLQQHRYILFQLHSDKLLSNSRSRKCNIKALRSSSRVKFVVNDAMGVYTHTYTRETDARIPTPIRCVYSRTQEREAAADARLEKKRAEAAESRVIHVPRLYTRERRVKNTGSARVRLAVIPCATTSPEVL